MFTAPDRERLHKIVILNPKGGSGKTTLATNLASYYAILGPPPTLMDCDPQGYCMRWLDRRPDNSPKIHGIAAYQQTTRETLKYHSQVWPDSEQLIVDLPAAVPNDCIYDHTYDADSILIPVLPSAIDVFAASRFIAELLLVAQIDRRDRQLAVVANRTRINTRSYQMLLRFLTSLSIPLIAQLRDGQNYVHAAAAGLGIYDMPTHKVRKDIEGMDSITNWLDEWRMRRLDAAASSDYVHIPGTEILTPTTVKPEH